jgi:hypothetical protein
VLSLPDGSTRHGGGLMAQLGGGIEFNFGHVLAEAAVIGGAEGDGGLGPNGQALSAPIASAGLELRIGYSQW